VPSIRYDQISRVFQRHAEFAARISRMICF
jgi:hypothetical protein